MSATILAVEDDPIVKKLVRTALEQAGYTVLSAGSGKEMFESLSRNPEIELVLLDLGLPDGDAMPHIMELREKTSLPIVVLTARGRQDDRLMALGLGADDYMTKPIDVRELVLRVGNMLARNFGEPRPSVAGLVGDPSRATPMPSGRVGKKPKSTISLGAMVGVVVFSLVVGAGVYLGMKSGIHDTPLRKQAASSASQPSTEPEPDEPALNIEPSVTGVAEPTVSVAPSAPAPAAVSQPEAGNASVATAVDNPSPVEQAVSTATIVTLPEPRPETTAPAPETPVDATTFTAAAPTEPRAVLLGYGWVLETKCAALPEVEWWGQKTHEEMAHYVTRRKDGDWDFYIAGLAEQLSTLYDISARGSAARTRTGERLEGDALKAYIDDAVKRIDVAHCLAAEAAAARAAGQ